MAQENITRLMGPDTTRVTLFWLTFGILLLWLSFGVPILREYSLPFSRLNHPSISISMSNWLAKIVDRRD